MNLINPISTDLARKIEHLFLKNKYDLPNTQCEYFIYTLEQSFNVYYMTVLSQNKRSFEAYCEINNIGYIETEKVRKIAQLGKYYRIQNLKEICAIEYSIPQEGSL